MVTVLLSNITMNSPYPPTACPTLPIGSHIQWGSKNVITLCFSIFLKGHHKGVGKESQQEIRITK
jgi:hypothetical protein